MMAVHRQGTRVQRAIATDSNVRVETDVRMQHAARADFASRADAAEGADLRARVNIRIFGDHSGAMNTGRRACLLRNEQADRTREVQAGIGRSNHCAIADFRLAAGVIREIVLNAVV